VVQPLYHIWKNSITNSIQSTQSPSFDEEIYILKYKEASNSQVATIRNQIFSMPYIREMLSKTRKDEVIQILKNYVKEELVDEIEENVSLVDLTSFLLWLDGILEPLNIHIVDVFPFPDAETGETLFIGVELKGCNSRDVWRALSRFIKDKMIKEGFKDLASEIGLICR